MELPSRNGLLNDLALKTEFKTGVLSVLSRLTGRHAVLLPFESRDEESILQLQTSYRVDGSLLRVDLLEQCQGTIKATLVLYDGAFPTKPIWSTAVAEYSGPCEFTFDVTTGVVRLSKKTMGQAPPPGRRFCWQIVIEGADGKRRERLTGHYVPANGKKVDATYYQGENYIDHEAQSIGDHQQVLELLKQHCSKGPVLEVGCATGGLLAILQENGFESFGIDLSDWAVTRANERLGERRAWRCDIEVDPLPADLMSHAPFRSLVLWAVFEHFHDPFNVLAKLNAVTAPGTSLLINTTNADSLTHNLFGTQWEGYFDWTHHGVDRVSVRTLRESLPQLGWRIEHLSTHLAWDCNADPTRATLRDWWAADARFRRLLLERERGDLITCVAIRNGS